ncbi:uncharacterized protein SPPG_08293 [Spizellomyces punctatus DAOM BR117]|uniref:Small acidic protein n=1 Tax=Spizellomyces punctatus (strain DAOM BR117) TaxID=645134 RepID=A0A0L0H5Z2_SPIPD|nr:uncharacterized protein SPPG_08293 [Spizellomyces punctatus DAOM BR117]KNC96394.1 hypothetical protein SPPG_08293 [Spizellomyces punctatus DAOM BR117]|eukprot:XP_016604434.1 hypothetical protein SPPG_08293 [Spizellomyces punctatus DAOM BR117]
MPSTAFTPPPSTDMNVTKKERKKKKEKSSKGEPADKTVELVENSNDELVNDKKRPGSSDKVAPKQAKGLEEHATKKKSRKEKKEDKKAVENTGSLPSPTDNDDSGQNVSVNSKKTKKEKTKKSKHDSMEVEISPDPVEHQQQQETGKIKKSKKKPTLEKVDDKGDIHSTRPGGEERKRKSEVEQPAEEEKSKKKRKKDKERQRTTDIEATAKDLPPVDKPEKDTDIKSLKDKKKTKKAEKAEKKKMASTSSESKPTTTAHAPKKDAQAPPAENQTVASGTGTWNDWSQASFEGDAARKNKFLRLLGAKKASNDAIISTTSSNAPTSAIQAEVGKKIEHDIVNQFEQGRAIQQKLRQGRRVGLGF